MRTSSGTIRRYSREAEDLEGISIVYSIQSHDHLEHAVKCLVIIRVVYGMGIGLLRKDENSEVDFHLPGSARSVVAGTKTGLMEAHEQLAFDCQVDNGLDGHGQDV